MREAAPAAGKSATYGARQGAFLHEVASGFLDTAAEREYDDITRIAAVICGTPISLVTLVDEQRQWFKSRHGIDATETPREWAFCSYAVRGTDTIVVPDATQDGRFVDNPLVTGEPRIRYYAGTPLIDSDGQALGTLCVIDRQPRELTLEQLDTLACLSRQVVAHFTLKRTAAQLAAALNDVKALTVLLPVCTWCRDVRSDDGYWESLEEFITREQGIDISHGICPTCYEQSLAEFRHKARN